MKVTRPEDGIMLLSGGVDSTVALAMEYNAGRHPLCLTFDYDQTLRKEVAYAKANAYRYGCQHRTIYLPMSEWFTNCGLMVNKEHLLASGRTPVQIAEAGTPLSYVPFRNGIFISIAAAIAEDNKLRRIVCGGNGLNSGNYWDDTAEFAVAMQKAIDMGTSPDWGCSLEFPNSKVPKSYVVKVGKELGVDFAATWSCYHNGDTHCGKCDSCVQRQEAGL